MKTLRIPVSFPLPRKFISQMASRNWTHSKEEKRKAKEAKELEESKERKRLRIDERTRGDNPRPMREVDKFSCLLQDEEPHNISGVVLNEGEKIALLLGPTFIPAQEVTQEMLKKTKTEIKESLQKYYRRIRNRCYFATCPDKPVPDFIVKRPDNVPPWICPDVTDDPIKVYIADCNRKFEEAWPAIEEKTHKIPNALPTHIRNGLRSLKNNPNIKICLVDKGGGLITTKPSWNHEQSMSHLGVTLNYTLCPNPPTPQQILQKLKELIEDSGRLWITNEADGKMRNHAAYILQASHHSQTRR